MINVVLFEPEIPQNTGNIMRTCAGTNVKLHLIKPLGFSLDEKCVKRSGANYIDKCDYTVYENFDDFTKKNKGAYYFLTRYATKCYCEENYCDKVEDIYLIFGRESTGIPKDILKKYRDCCLRIPTNDKIRALNLSNCVSIMTFEVLRQNHFRDLLVYDPFKGKNYLEE